MHHKPRKRTLTIALALLTIILAIQILHNQQETPEYPPDAFLQAAKLANTIDLEPLKAILGKPGVNIYPAYAATGKNPLDYWNISMGLAAAAPIPPGLKVPHLNPLLPISYENYSIDALYLYPDQGIARASRTLIDSVDTPFRITVVGMVARPDGAPVMAQPGISYMIQAPGIVAASGPLSYDTILPHLALGDALIVANASGELRLYPPTPGALPMIEGVYLGPDNMYTLDGAPVIVDEAMPLEGRLLFGGDLTWILEERDNVTAAITPGNPVIVKVPSSGVPILDTAPGVSRSPALLRLYTYTGEQWSLREAIWIMPAKGTLLIPVEPSPGGLALISTTSTIIVDRAAWAPWSSVEEIEPGALDPVEYSVEYAEDGSHILIRYPEARGKILVHVAAPRELGPVRVMAGAHISLYGDLVIAGPPVEPVAGAWGFSWSDVVEVPEGARDLKLELVALGSGDEPPVMILYLKHILYPVIAAAMEASSGVIDYQMQTVALAGISSAIVDYRSVDAVYVNIVMGRAVKGEPLLPLKLGVDGLSIGYCVGYNTAFEDLKFSCRPTDGTFNPIALLAPGNTSAGLDYATIMSIMWGLGEPTTVHYHGLFQSSKEPDLARNIPQPIRLIFKQALEHVVTYDLIKRGNITIYGKEYMFIIHDVRLGLLDREDIVYLSLVKVTGLSFTGMTTMIIVFNTPAEPDTGDSFHIMYHIKSSRR